MASKEPITTATVTLTREQRDAIYEEIATVVDGAGELRKCIADGEFDERDRDWFKQIGRRISLCARLLAQLGWQRRADRDTYRLGVDADVASFMERFERSAREQLEEDRPGLRREREGYAECGLTFSDEEWAKEKQTASIKGMMDMDLDGIDAARICIEAYRKAVA